MSMTELPKNPNTRPPYSDVYQELDYYQGQIVEFLGISKAEMGPADWSNLQGYLKRLDRAMLRVRAVLDPTALSDDDWKLAVIDAYDKSLGDTTAFMAGGKVRRGSEIVAGKRPWWRFW